MPSPRRSWIAALVFAVALLVARGAAAQFAGTTGSLGIAGTTGTTTSFDASDFFIGVQETNGSNLSDFDVARFFNKARCDCSETVYIYVTLVDSGFAKRSSVPVTVSSTIDFWVGTNCSDIVLYQSQCKLLKSESLLTFLMNGHDTLTTDARVLSTYSSLVTYDDGGTATSTPFPPNGNPDCTAPVPQFNQNIWALISLSGTPGSYDTQVSRAIQITLTPPPPPDSDTVTVQGADQALIVNWTKLDTSIYTNLLGYQLLCSRGPGLQVFDNGTFSPGFMSDAVLAETGLTTCPAPSGTGIGALDPNFICSPLLTTSANSYRIKILQNDIVYGVAVVSVDNSSNPSGLDIFYGTPIKTKTFYDVYRDGNTGSGSPYPAGQATGGYCAVGPARPRRGATLAGLGLAIATIGFAVVRRRRQGR